MTCTLTQSLELVSPPVVKPGTIVHLKAKIKNDCWFHFCHVYIYLDNELKADNFRFYLAPAIIKERLELEIPKDISDGLHIITVRTSDEAFENLPGKSVQIYVGSPEKKGILKVKSEPSGAEVYLNDKYVGNTPLSIILDPGTYTVKVSKKGYKPFERKVQIIAGQITPVFAKLQPISETPEKPWLLALGAGIAGIATGILAGYAKRKGYHEIALAKAKEIVKRR